MNTNENEHIDSESMDVGDEFKAVEGESAEEKAERLENLNKQLFSRAKKAEGFELKDGKWVKKTAPASEQANTTTATESPKSEVQMSQTDMIAIVRADVPDEDISEIVEYATFKKISVAEALKTPFIKNVLEERAENRKVAEGTNTGANKRNSGALTDETLLNNARKGIMPESDEDIRRLTVLQRAKK